MKRNLISLSLSAFGLVLVTLFSGGSAQAYSDSRLMDNAIFDNVNTMNEAQIRSFINSRPTSCLATSGAIFPEPITYWQYGGNVDAARVIYNAAQYSAINPQVILATLEKEQTLISRINCYEASGIDSRNKAMGQGCPDGGACPAPAYAGFHQQVMKGSWQLMFNRQRAVGNIGWGDNGSITYSGYMTQGNFKRCTSCSTIYYDGYGTVDGQTIYMSTAATASFYTYTPHLGQAFPGIFEKWFGPTMTPNYASGYAGQCVYPTIQAGASANCHLSYKNNGNQAWHDDVSAGAAGANPVHLATSHVINRTSSFGSSWGGDQNRPAGTFAAVYEADGVTLAANQHIAQVGQIAKFNFTLTAPTSLGSGVHREYFQPIVEGGSSMNDPGTFLDITVTDLHASAYSSQSTSPATIKPGQKSAAFIAYKNAGNTRWCDDIAMQSPAVGCNRVRLATSNPINRTSLLGSEWGGDQNRAATVFAAVYLSNGTTLATDQHSALPGQIIKFAFNFTVPAGQAATTLNEYFQPIVEGGSTMNDPGTFLIVDIPSASTSSSEVVSSQQMVAGSSKTLLFSTTNTGNTTWTPSNTKLMTANSSAQSFRASSWLGNNVVGPLKEASVAPGGIGTFDLYLSASMASGVHSVSFKPGDGAMTYEGSSSPFNITIQAPTFTSAYSSQSAYPTINQGQAASAWLRYKNTGNVAWYDDATFATGPAGTKPVHLATSHGINRKSALGQAWGGDQNRPASLFGKVLMADGVTLAPDQHIVQPGQIAEFSFGFAAGFGQRTGNYREYFQPIVEGGDLMNDPGTFLDVTVQTGTYASQYYGQSSYPSIAKPGSGTTTAAAYFMYKNAGNAPWYDNASAGPGTRPTVLATSHPINRLSPVADTSSWCNGIDRNRASCLFSAVYEADGTTLAANQHVALPGQIVKFDFNFAASSTTSLGTYREFLHPIIESGPIMNDPGTFLDVTVN